MFELALLVIVTAGCIWLITTPRVHTGILITAGLVLIACGNLGMMDQFSFTVRAYELRTEGMALIAWGLFWRLAALPWWRKNLADQGFARALARHVGVDRRQVDRR